jgi:hypothetical protein
MRARGRQTHTVGSAALPIAQIAYLPADRRSSSERDPDPDPDPDRRDAEDPDRHDDRYQERAVPRDFGVLSADVDDHGGHADEHHARRSAATR